MSKALSVDLRERVIAAIDEGMSCRGHVARKSRDLEAVLDCDVHRYQPSQELIDKMAALTEERTGVRPTDAEATLMLRRLVGVFSLLSEWERKEARQARNA